MYRVHTPFLFIPSVEARRAIGALVRLPGKRLPDGRVLPPSEAALARATERLLRDAATAAFREVVVAAKGLEIASLQFTFHSLTLAVSARVRPDGVVEIEAGLGDPAARASVFTAAQVKAGLEAARRRARLREQQRRVWR